MPLAEVARFPREEEAVVAVTFLQAHGVHASLFDDVRGAANAGYAYFGEFRVMVPDAELGDAAELLAQIEHSR